ncbi:probable Kinesin-3 motor protein [Pseudozyma flocculosa]|uniref:Probable Kinesin-3 motor protein n=1 Tax=Pseudozyma flocculosa TaxID=84751 RepID=A0A5C3F8Z3_9BASI|nr:probable Kinesin-3 motor protein [Pseudozyma flocculosa]
MSDGGNIKVVVRCRPMNSRERTRGATNLIEFNGDKQLVLSPPQEGDTKENAKASKKKSMPFSFDRAYDENTEQSTLFNYIGIELLEHAFNGFNTCVFAYGQTGSGKSHSMVGYAEAKGLIPLTCSKLFDDVDEKMASDPHLKISVEVSYIEIYNEKVRDLLNPKNKGNLKVREHPSLGPYVEDLSKLVVSSFRDIENLMDEGNKARTVAATNMNETSSRSHAVFTLVLTQKKFDPGTKLEAEKVSRISLVDLAGSERANSTGATGARLKEGANINRSLTTLGKVIAALAIASGEPAAKGKKKAALESFVPYRDSVLTWLLKDSLGGNSKTAMIAAISPADYEETLSTLRYADQAKKIKNKAVVNEDPNAKLIRELKEELEMLRTRVSGGGGVEGEGTWDPTVPPEKQVVRYQTKSGEIKTVTKAELEEQLEQSEKIMSSLNESWEEKLQKTQEIQKEREKALEELGISVDKGNVGVHTPKKLPHLVNLNEDPLMSECLIYQIKPGRTLVGSLESSSEVQIKLSGTNILAEHCIIQNDDGAVTVEAMPDSMTMVNGKRLTPGEPKRLRSGYRVILGDFHVFRFNHPEEVRKARDRVKSTLALSTGDGDNETLAEGESPATRPDSPASGDVDWTYARREYAIARLNGQDVNFDNLNEEDLEKLFEDISKARHKKSIVGGGRPESRASFLDDNASESASSFVRHYSLGAMTDDTSIDPWSQGGSDFGSMRVAGDGATPASAAAAAKEPRSETETLKMKVREYEERFTRMAASSPGLDSPRLDFKVEYTDEQKRLIRWVLGRWRGHTTVSMAEDALSKAVLVKEANVISKELGKDVTYQFTVVDDVPLANPTSNVEAIAGLTEFDDVADPDLARSAKPCMAVKVLDYAHTTAYVWSIAKFEQRLQKMRNLYTFIDKPEYSQHFNWADPFYETPTPSYTFVGSALIPLNPLSRHVTARYRLPILSRHTGKRIGSCSVQLKFVSLSLPAAANGRNGHANGEAMSPTPSSTGSGSRSGAEADLPAGHKLGLQLVVDSVSGISRDDFASVHIQVRLSSLAGPTIAKDEVYPSIPTELADDGSLSDVRLRRTISFILTPETASWMRNGFAPIEFHAKVRPDYLAALERHDADREAARVRPGASADADMSFEPAPAPSPSPSPRTDALTTAERPELGRATTSQGRLSEKEMVSEEKHHILAFVQICELDASGEYRPVPVKAQSTLDPGCFFLRQGLQRKLVINLSHDSGRQFNWTRFSKIELSDVRLLDPRGRVHGSKVTDPIALKAPGKQQGVEFLSNGTSELSLWAWWDSSVHDSLYLNRVTAANHRVLLQLNFEVDVESCARPVRFAMDIALSINGRDAKPPGRLMSLLESATSGSRTLAKASALFSVRLVPPMTKRTRELWRLDTATKYVRGQETLRGWKARGVSLVHDHDRLVRTERRRAEVEGVRALLKASPPLSLSLSPGGEGGSADGEGMGPGSASSEQLMAKVLELWQRAVRDSKMAVLAEESSAEEEARRLAQTAASASAGATATATNAAIAGSVSPLPLPPAQAQAEPVKLTAEVSLVARSDNAAKRGWLMMPVEAFSDQWIKRWFALRRPFLYVYESNSELDEIMAINVASVRVEHDENIEAMLERQHVFGAYTASNSYFLQAPSAKDMEAWMQALDSLYSTRSGGATSEAP